MEKKKKDFEEKVGKKIKEIRKEKKITRAQFASRAKIEKATISGLEAGLVNMTIFMLLNISDALEVPVTELLKF